MVVLNVYKQTEHCVDGCERQESEHIDEDLEFETLEEAKEYFHNFYYGTELGASCSGCGTITYYVATVHCASEWHKFQENYEAEPLPLWEWDSRTRLEIEAWERAVSSNKAKFDYRNYEFDNVQQAYSSLCEQKKNCLKKIETIVKYFNNKVDVREVANIIDEYLHFDYAEEQDAYNLASRDRWDLLHELAESCELDEYGGFTLEDQIWLEGWENDYFDACVFIKAANKYLENTLDELYHLVDEEREEELWNELYDLARQYAPNAFNWREERRLQYAKEASGYYGGK